MTDDKFSSWYEQNHAAYKAWGEFVARTIEDLVMQELGEKGSPGFFKAKSLRVKELASATAKIRRKEYTNPTAQMTDMVGVRFVVLLRTDLDVLDRCILGCQQWVSSRDRHFEFEVLEDPTVFEYQSVHYVVRNREVFLADGVLIPEDMACEVQVRTLLQHAYAELVHDRIYKEDKTVPANARRLVARCMALMESTDDFFEKAAREIEEASRSRQQWSDLLGRSYYGLGGSPVNVEMEGMILDTYRDLLSGTTDEDLQNSFAAPAVRQRIAQRAGNGGLFGQPVCLVLYWLLDRHHAETLRRWPYPAYTEDLHRICADLGSA